MAGTLLYLPSCMPVVASQIKHSEHVLSSERSISIVKVQLPASCLPAASLQHGSLKASQADALFQAAATSGRECASQSCSGRIGRNVRSLHCRATTSGRPDGGAEKVTAKGGPLDGPATPFHLAFPVNDLEATREFYGK
jgi:hypothetical protein